MDSAHDPGFDERLRALRARLKSARDERGGCPPWEELRADLLPGGRGRPGREARLTHLAACPYCDTHVGEWKRSFDHTADALAAVERGVVTGLAGGARDLVRRFARRPSAGAPPATPPPESPVPPVSRPTPPVPHPAPPAPARPAPAPLTATRILVVEMADRRPPPEAVFLCAAVLEAEVAVVDGVDELASDPDLALVCGIVLGGFRPTEAWPAMVRTARGVAAGRPVVLLAPFGSNPSAGARRALGEALIGEDEPAERLLLALDPTLR